jgi:hypothetical protein
MQITPPLSSTDRRSVGIELLIPFLIFPRRVRYSAPVPIGMQVLILITGNYILQSADHRSHSSRLTIKRWRFVPPSPKDAGKPHVTGGPRRRIRRRRVMVSPHRSRPSTANCPPENGRRQRPLQIVNTYGPFAVMTTERIEIVSKDRRRRNRQPRRTSPATSSAPGLVAPTSRESTGKCGSPPSVITKRTHGS